jgi:hypothetical protein
MSRDIQSPTMSPTDDSLMTAFMRIEALETELRGQMEFIERIERVDTGWWDKDEMAKQKAAIWNLLEPGQ